MENEVWRDIEGYTGLYQVSSWGRVKSLERMRWCGNGGYYKMQERILKPSKNKKYLRVYLYKEGAYKWYLIHRLVAKAFLPNPSNLPIINHKDENKLNNNVNNLEWCSYSYNNSYNNRAKKVGEKRGKAVVGVHIVTGEKVFFSSTHEAERQIGIDQTSICKCCNGKQKTAKGFYWHYLEDQNREEN